MNNETTLKSYKYIIGTSVTPFILQVEYFVAVTTQQQGSLV